MIMIVPEFDARTREQLRRGMTPEDGVAMLQAVEDGLAKSRNYETAFRRGQGAWEPLDTAYRAWKARQMYDVNVWAMKGDAFDALTTPINVNAGGGANEYGRQVSVSSNPGGGYVAADWIINAPAARGWFERNDAIRPWVNTVTPEAIVECEQLVRGVVVEALVRMGAEVL